MERLNGLLTNMLRDSARRQSATPSPAPTDDRPRVVQSLTDALRGETVVKDRLQAELNTAKTQLLSVMAENNDLRDALRKSSLGTSGRAGGVAAIAARKSVVLKRSADNASLV